MLNIDKTASALVQEELKGITLYLDTNFLLNLLGFNGEKRKKSAELVINLSKRFKCQLLISSRTINEWHASLKKAEKELTGPTIRLDLTDIAKRYLREDDFLITYWTRHAETGVSVGDFLSPFRRLQDHLRTFQIEEEGKLWNKIRDSQELKDEMDKLDIIVHGLKPTEVLEHDAFHRLLILHRRGDTSSRSFIDTKFWFLTCDTSLPKYHREIRKDKDDMPFCILTHQWIQILRPLLERTDDYDSAFVNLLNSPYLRTHAPLPEDVVKSIIGRISFYKQYTSSLVTRMLMDKQLTDQLHQIRDEQKRYELIDNESARIAAEMEIELKKITDIYKKQEIYKAQLEKQRDALRTSSGNLQKQCTEIQTQRDIEKQQRQRLEQIIKYGAIAIGIAFIIIILLILVVFKVL
jgi:uncharacterized protein YeeX (DUF496 family)